MKAVCFDDKRKEVRRTSLFSSNETEQRISMNSEENEVHINEVLYVNVNFCNSNGAVESNDDVKIKLIVQGTEMLPFVSANPRTEEKNGQKRMQNLTCLLLKRNCGCFC